MKNSKGNTDRKAELKTALDRSLLYLFSHHTSENLNRCWRLKVYGKDLRFCARCTGIYPGILLGLIFYPLYGTFSEVLIFASGLPTAIEKYLTGVKDYEGYNSVRTFTGIILGAGFIQGVIKLTEEGFSSFTAFTAVFYAFLVPFLIYLENPSILEA